MRKPKNAPSTAEDTIILMEHANEVPLKSAQSKDKAKNSDETLELSANPGNEVAFEKVQLSLFTAVNMIVGMMIGSGIFASPGPVLEQAGSTGAALLIWFLAGAVSLFGALGYVELGTLMKQDGGEQIYLHKAFGEFASFLFVWFTCIIGKPCSIAIIASVFGTYFASIFGIQSFFIHQIISVLLIIVLTAVNCVSATAGLKLQDTTTVLKVAALSFMVAIGFVFCVFSSSEQVEVAGFTFNESSTRAFSYVNALYLALWAFDGFNSLNLITSEVSEPNKNLPKAISISLLLTILCYLLANLTYFFVLSKQEIVRSTSIAVDVGTRIFGPAGGVIFMLAVAISCVGTTNGSIYTAGRLFKASAEASLIPFSDFFLKESGDGNIPKKSLIFQGLLSCVFVFSGSYAFLVQLYGFTAWIFYTSTVIGLLVLRRRTEFISDTHAYRAPLFLIVLFIISGIALIIVSFTDPEIVRILIGCAVTLITGLLYLFLRDRFHFNSNRTDPRAYRTVSGPPSDS